MPRFLRRYVAAHPPGKWRVFGAQPASHGLSAQPSAKGARMVKPLRMSEKWTVNPDHMTAIEDAIADVSPDLDALQPWYQRYSARQKKRLSFDLGQVEEVAKPGDSIVEFGAIPPILTVALARRGHSICGLDLAPARFRIRGGGYHRQEGRLRDCTPAIPGRRNRCSDLQ